MNRGIGESPGEEPIVVGGRCPGDGGQQVTTDAAAAQVRRHGQKCELGGSGGLRGGLRGGIGCAARSGSLRRARRCARGRQTRVHAGPRAHARRQFEPLEAARVGRAALPVPRRPACKANDTFADFCQKQFGCGRQPMSEFGGQFLEEGIDGRSVRGGSGSDDWPIVSRGERHGGPFVSRGERRGR